MGVSLVGESGTAWALRGGDAGRLRAASGRAAGCHGATARGGALDGARRSRRGAARGPGAAAGGRAATRFRVRSSGGGGDPGAGESGKGFGGPAPDDANADALSAVEELMSGERGVKLDKAMQEVQSLRERLDAMEREAADAGSSKSRLEEAERERQREEALAELQQRLADVDRAQRSLQSERSKIEGLVGLLDEEKEKFKRQRLIVIAVAFALVVVLNKLVLHH